MPNYFLVSETNNIEGVSDKAVEVMGLRCIEGPFAAPWDVWSDGKEIFLKPPKPSEEALWDDKKKEWIVINPPDPPASPDYFTFRRAMLQDTGYDRVTLASKVLRVTRMETAVAQNPPELQIVADMWNALIEELTEKPKAAEVKSWNAIAQANNVPIKFGKDGKMNLT